MIYFLIIRLIKGILPGGTQEYPTFVKVVLVEFVLPCRFTKITPKSIMKGETMKKPRVLFLCVLGLLLLLGLVATEAYAAGGLVIVENHSEPGVVKLMGGRTTIYFAQDTCAVKCRFNQTLPDGAYNNLHQVRLPYLTGVYTLLPVDKSDSMLLPGDFPTDGYTVCFGTNLVGQPAVYRYAAGEWTFLSETVLDEQICVDMNGNSVLGFFGIMSERLPAMTPTATSDPCAASQPPPGCFLPPPP